MTQEVHTVYKIVRFDRDAYASISFCEGDIAYVRYYPGQWAHAPEAMRRLGYDLCVFRDLTCVRSYVAGPVGRLPDWELWRCKARGVRQPLVFSLGEEFVTAFVRAALDGPALDIESIPYGAWPRGTLFARAVRLVERVPWERLDEVPR